MDSSDSAPSHDGGLQHETETVPWLPTREDADGKTSLQGVLSRGACLGRYVILHPLGSGGMGTVYAAFDPELDRPVALKVLRADHLLSQHHDRAHQRLQREARAAARLVHPNVVSIHDVGRANGRLFIAMERIDGVTLDVWLRQESRPWSSILQVFAQIGAGLDAAHQSGLVHRDVKASNIMVTADGEARLLDFGLALAAETSEDNAADLALPAPKASTASLGRTLGTPVYAAPELHRGRPADARSDQFSFCVTLYEALFDQLPFAGQDLESYRQRMIAGDVQPPSADSRVPSWVTRHVLRGLAKDPEQRFASMRHLLNALGDDPAIVRRRWWIWVSWILPIALAGWLFALRPDAPACDASERWHGLWDAPRRASITAALESHGAGHLSPEVARRLDGYTARWKTLYEEACRATHTRGERSLAVLERQIACLDDRQHEVDTLLRLLEHRDPKVLENALSAIGSLTSLASCADWPTLGALDLPLTPELRQDVAERRAQLAELRALERAGLYQQVLERSETAIRRSQELGLKPLVGEAFFLRSIAQGRLGHRDAWRASLLEAYTIAQATHHFELLAESAIYLILSGYTRGDLEDAALWGRLAAAAIEGLGGRADLEARRRAYLGNAAILAEDPHQAIDHYEASLRLDPDLAPADRSARLNNLGLAYLHAENYANAEERLHQSIDLLTQAAGDDHPFLAAPWRNLGKLNLARGRPAEALPLLERSIAIHTSRFGDEHPDLAFSRTAKGEALLALGRPSEAVEALERVVQSRLRVRENPADLAQGRFLLAQALWDAGTDRRRARSLAEEARNAYEELGQDEAHRRITRWLESREAG